MAIRLFASPSPTDVLNSQWDFAVHEYEKGDVKSAVHALERWTTLSHQHHIVSPEAFYNLGLLQWSLKEQGPAIFNILKSATLRISPFRIWKDLETLSDLEKNIGVKDGNSQKLGFHLFLLFNDSMILLFLSIGVWALATLLLLKGVFRIKKAPALRTVLSVIGCFACLVATTTFINRKFVSQFGVLDSTHHKIALYRSSESKEQEKLIDLSPGTIITIATIQDKFIQITQPIAGWVSKKEVLLLDN